MRVKGLVWLGVPTERYRATVDFFANVLGLRVEFDHGTTTELSATNGDRVQLFSPEDGYFEFFRTQGCRVVPLFEVDDLDEARAELSRAGVDVIGACESDSAWTWIHVRGPDGNLYELAARRSS
jgi:predicted enzyme related to lactoylglutathione lyase